MRKKLTLTILLLWFMTGYANAESKVSFCFDPWPPVHSIAESGEPVGVFIDVVRALFEKKLGWQVDYVLLPWKRCQSYVSIGSIDFMITVPTAERRQYSIASDRSVYDIYSSVYAYRGHDKINLINQIKQPEDVVANNLTVVTYLGNGWYKKHFVPAGVKTTYLNGISAAIQFVALKRADLYIGGNIVADYQIKELGLQDKIVQTDVHFDPFAMHVMVSKKSPLVEKLPELNKALNQFLDSKQYREILAEYGLKGRLR